MTEGRLETIHNLRPENWDNRRHWTNWHHLYDCEQDHIARESAPFHDLRAGGQFQYEYWGAGPHAEPIEPQHVAARKHGDRMDFAPGKGTNMGGWGDMPVDTEPGRPQKTAATMKRSAAVFTKKNPLNRGLFSTYEWMPEGGEDDRKTRGLKTAPRAAPRELPDVSKRAGALKAGGPVHYIGQQPEYIPDPYRDTPDYGRISHFKTGVVPHDDPRWMPEGEKEKKKARSYGPFLAGKPNGFTIGGDQEWIPDPYDKGQIKSSAHPFRTWHTRTKWSMPTGAPWSTGLATAEKRQAAQFDTTDVNLPSLRNDARTNLAQTIGSEAARGTMNPPEAVQFRSSRM